MKKLGEMLVEQRLVSSFHVERALFWQQDDGGRIGGLLIRLGYLEEDVFLRVMAPLLHSPSITLRDDAIDPYLLRRVPAKIARRAGAIALAIRNDRLVVAMADPSDLKAIGEVEAVTGLRVESHLAADPSIARVLDRFYPPAEPSTRAVAPRDVSNEALVEPPVQDTSRALDRLLHGWFRDALVAGATHLVIEMTPLFLVVRCEMVENGFELVQLGAVFHRPLIARLRAAADLPIPKGAGWRQSGTVPFRYRGLELRLEMTILPSSFGPTARIALGEAGADTFRARTRRPALIA